MVEETAEIGRGNDPQQVSSRTLRRRAKKAAALARRRERFERLGGPPETTFVGRHKWLGGAVDPETGDIYGIPSHSHMIICISPPGEAGDGVTEGARITTYPLPQEHQRGQFKWLRGLVHGRKLYGIPAWNAGGVLRMDLATRDVEVLPLPRREGHYRRNVAPSWPVWNAKRRTAGAGGEAAPAPGACPVDEGRWMWHGGAVGRSADGTESIYCPPSNAERVLKVGLGSPGDGAPAVEEIGPSLAGVGPGQNKFYGGILGLDGAVYSPPYSATGVLRIDPKDDSVEVLGTFEPGRYHWHGGLLCRRTGRIYAFPAHSNEVLCIDTNIRDGDDGGDHEWRVSTIPIQRHEDDTDPPDLRYKWLGGSHGADGCIYGMPSDATTILRIDPERNEATTFGTVDGGRNKWQGGVLSSVDGCVYAVPADHGSVLRIDTRLREDGDGRPPGISLVGEGFQEIDDKWQGGFAGTDGRIYAIPENCNHVMVVTPGETPTAEMLKPAESRRLTKRGWAQK